MSNIVWFEELLDPTWYAEHSFFQLSVDYEKIAEAEDNISLDSILTWFYTFLFRVLSFQDVVVLEPTLDRAAGYMFVRQCPDGRAYLKDMFTTGELDTTYMAFLRVEELELGSCPPVAWHQAYFRLLRNQLYKFVDDGLQLQMLMDEVSGEPALGYRTGGCVVKLDSRYQSEGLHTVYGFNLKGGRCHHAQSEQLQQNSWHGSKQPSKPVRQVQEGCVEVSLTTGARMRVEEIEEYWCDLEESLDAVDIWTGVFGRGEDFLRDVQQQDPHALTPVVVPRARKDRGALHHQLGLVSGTDLQAYFVQLKGADEYNQLTSVPASLAAHLWEPSSRLLTHEVSNGVADVQKSKLSLIRPSCTQLDEREVLPLQHTLQPISSGFISGKAIRDQGSDPAEFRLRAVAQISREFSAESTTKRTIIDEDAIAVQKAFAGIFSGEFASRKAEYIKMREEARKTQEDDWMGSADDDLEQSTHTSIQQEKEEQRKEDENDHQVLHSLFNLVSTTIRSLPTELSSDQRLSAIHQVISKCLQQLNIE